MINRYVFNDRGYCLCSTVLLGGCREADRPGRHAVSLSHAYDWRRISLVWCSLQLCICWRSHWTYI